MEILPFILVALVAGGIAWLSYWLKQQRRQAFASFAHRFGLDFAHHDPFGLVGHDFSLFRMGDGRDCENVLWGEWQGLPVKAADYWYYTDSTDSRGHRSRSYRRFSVVVADLEVFVPRVSIQRENPVTRLADHAGFRDIDFESGEFNRRFEVKARDREFAYRLIDARMMHWLLETGGKFGFEINGSHLLLSCSRRKPDQLVPLLGTAKGFRDAIPRMVWVEYGLSPGPDRTERSST